MNGIAKANVDDAKKGQKLKPPTLLDPSKLPKCYTVNRRGYCLIPKTSISWLNFKK